MHRIDEICNHNGQMEDVYSEFNKWSFESKWLGGLCFVLVFFFCLRTVSILYLLRHFS